MRRTFTRAAATVSGLALLLGVAACSTGSTDSATDTSEPATSADADAFPVTVEHAFGETTIEEEPVRVATLGWTDHDHALALGVVPVGATKLTWGGNEEGSSDWFDAALEDLGGEAPVRYDDSDGAPVQEIAALSPDLILATNSGITEAEYKKLSKIAPVVAYPEAPWVTDWRTSLGMVGEALGRSDRADELVEETEATIADAKEEHPSLEGTSFVFAFLSTADMSTVGLYGRQDPRVALMEDFGLVSADVVDETVEDGQFYGTLSAEDADSVESDILISYGETEDDLQTFTDHPLLGQIPALEAGRAYVEVDKEIGLALTNPSPISVPFIVDNIIPHVAEVAGAS